MRVRNLMFLLLGIQARVRARSNQDTPSFPQRKQIRFKLWRLFVRSVTSHISFRLCYRSGRSILIPLQGLIMYLRFLKTKTFPFTHASFPSSTSHFPSILHQHHHLIIPEQTHKIKPAYPIKLPHLTQTKRTAAPDSHTQKQTRAKSPDSHIIHT